MRAVWIVLLVASCGTSTPACPTSPTSVDDLPTCAAANAGQRCEIPAPSTSISQRPDDCVCNDGRWACNDCPGDQMAPIGACATNDTCEASSFEFDCDCTCNAAGQWSCTAEESNAPPGECGSGS